MLAEGEVDIRTCEMRPTPDGWYWQTSGMPGWAPARKAAHLCARHVNSHHVSFIC